MQIFYCCRRGKRGGHIYCYLFNTSNNFRRVILRGASPGPIVRDISAAHFCRRCELFGTCPRYNRVTVRRQWPRPHGTHRWLQLCEFSTSASPPQPPRLRDRLCVYTVVILAWLDRSFTFADVWSSMKSHFSVHLKIDRKIISTLF